MTVTGIGQPYITHYPDYAVANNKLLTLANSLAPISYLVCYQGFRANVEPRVATKILRRFGGHC